MFDYFRFRQRIKNGCYKLLSQLLYARFFYHFGRHSKLVSPLVLRNTRNISIGDRTSIGDGVFMMVENHKKQDNSCHLSIGNGVTIGHSNHIVALDSVQIEDNVLTADRVYISDNTHSYEDINMPISHQEVISKGPTIIGEGSWLGENVCVISASVGKHCVIAANSVVINNIPDFSIAAGAPAVVKKRYDFNKRQWKKV